MSQISSESAWNATVTNRFGRKLPAKIDPGVPNRERFFPAIVSVYFGAVEHSRWIRPVMFDGHLSLAAWGGCDVAVQDAEQRLMNLGYERI
jgi:hypothetical protein